MMPYFFYSAQVVAEINRRIDAEANQSSCPCCLSRLPSTLKRLAEALIESMNNPVVADQELLALALVRLADNPRLPDTLWLKYQPDVDLLCIKFKDRPHPTRTEDDPERGLIFNYEDQNLVSIEVLDLYGVFDA